MVFSSITFLFYFLPLFLLAYFLLPAKNITLLLASLLFYAWGEVEYTLLLLFSIAINYVFGRLIGFTAAMPKRQKIMLGLGVAANLLLLCYFKYFNFVLQEVLGITPTAPVHLPLGISFFTFQAISYLVDVYRKAAPVEKNPLDLGLYIAMFPQLIAGPIVRFKTVAAQIKQRQHRLHDIHAGVQLFIFGLAQKVLIANTAAIPADRVFGLDEAALTTGLAWLGAVCYAIQIFFDFAGYSNMAIGLGLVLGFTFPINFNYPYVAQSITAFWRRWHMSLSSWFRDYLYIPLGGNRISPWRTYVNLLLVFVLCGLWHGAAWVFVLWGLYHGLFLILERVFLAAWLQRCWRPWRHLYTLLVVLFGWVLFRAENLPQAGFFMRAMLGFSAADTGHGYVGLTNWTLFVLPGALFLAMPVYPYWQTLKAQTQQRGLISAGMSLATELFCLLVLVVSLSFVASGSYNPFIYFRF